eukprot:637429-Amphidinium_carterae.1
MSTTSPTPCDFAAIVLHHTSMPDKGAMYCEVEAGKCTHMWHSICMYVALPPQSLHNTLHEPAIVQKPMRANPGTCMIGKKKHGK